MDRLVLGLFAEGVTDESFFPSVIQRTSEELLKQRKHSYIDVAIRVIPKDTRMKKRAECILQAARNAVGCNILLVHCDADHPTHEKALQERYLPGYELVQKSHEVMCKQLVPIIPIRMTEAWMLAADHALLLKLMRTNMKPQELGLVSKVKQVESDPDPKQTLKTMMQRACAERSRRRRDVDLEPLYAALGYQIRLDRLRQVPSYQQFVQDLTTTLQALKLLQ